MPSIEVATLPSRTAKPAATPDCQAEGGSQLGMASPSPHFSLPPTPASSVFASTGVGYARAYANAPPADARTRGRVKLPEVDSEADSEYGGIGSWSDAVLGCALTSSSRSLQADTLGTTGRRPTRYRRTCSSLCSSPAPFSPRRSTSSSRGCWPPRLLHRSHRRYRLSFSRPVRSSLAGRSSSGQRIDRGRPGRRKRSRAKVEPGEESAPEARLRLMLTQDPGSEPHRVGPVCMGRDGSAPLCARQIICPTVCQGVLLPLARTDHLAGS